MRAGSVAAARNRPCRACRFQQGRAGNVVGIGKTGLFPGNRAYAHALLDGVGAVLDDAVLHAPALAPGMLEIQVAKVDTRSEQLAKGRVQAIQIQAGRYQQTVLRQAEHVVCHLTLVLFQGALHRQAPRPG